MFNPFNPRLNGLTVTHYLWVTEGGDLTAAGCRGRWSGRCTQPVYAGCGLWPDHIQIDSTNRHSYLTLFYVCVPDNVRCLCSITRMLSHETLLFYTTLYYTVLHYKGIVLTCDGKVIWPIKILLQYTQNSFPLVGSESMVFRCWCKL